MNGKVNATRNLIAGFQGSWSSGLAYLVFQDGSSVAADNGPLVRALDGVTGGEFIAPGHSVDNRAIEGLDIVYSLDDFGLTLAGFSPYEDWLDRGLPELAVGESIEFDPAEYLEEEVV